MKAQVADRIGIYVRESRDDYGEKHETIETQRELLVDYACRHGLGQVCSIYEDDNVSGSGFERAGIERLREDVLTGRIDLLLVKDLSRLGRNNAKTLQFLDFLEEYGVRVLSSDGRYDSRLGDDLVGIETWANERYIR
jgi:DNA invertase Pin-like site-specific DNA recombinase